MNVNVVLVVSNSFFYLTFKTDATMAAILVECVNDTVCYVFRGLKNCTNNSASSIIHAFVPLMNRADFLHIRKKVKRQYVLQRKIHTHGSI